MRFIFLLGLVILIGFNGCGSINVSKRQQNPESGCDAQSCGNQINTWFQDLSAENRVNIINVSDQAVRALLLKLYPSESSVHEAPNAYSLEMRMGMIVHEDAVELSLSNFYFEIQIQFEDRLYKINNDSFSEETLAVIPSLNSFTPSFRNLVSSNLDSRIIINGRYNGSTLEIDQAPTITTTILGLGTLTIANYQNNMCDFLMAATTLFPSCFP